MTGDNAPAAGAQTTPTSIPLQLCIGGLDKSRTSELDIAVREHTERLPAFAAAGATSHETYVRWNMIEPERGKFDFTFFDRLLEIREKNNIRWVPFLIAGSAYTLPPWFYKGPDHSGYVCLEHGEQSDIQSLWNPRLRPHVQRVIENFCKHYAGDRRIESVLLGITGNYGESIYPASGLDWTADAHGPYHTHYGWWAGDKDAVASFRKYAAKQYPDLKALNRDWGTTFTAVTEMKPRLPQDWPTSAARQHQSLWYLDSMNEWADFWMRTAKKELPDTDVYLVVGGHAPPHHGFDISAQAELAARAGCGLRVTNESDSYKDNYAITRMVVSACRLYGTFFSIEPAGLVTEKGIAARVFNASASGAKNLHWYDGNLFTSAPSEQKWAECRRYATQRDPVLDVAVFYPRRWMNLRADPELIGMYDDFVRLRNAFDYDYIDERMIESGRIKPGTYKALFLRDDFVEDEVTSRAIEKVKQSGIAKEIITFRKWQLQSPKDTEMLADFSRRVHPEDDFTTGLYFSRFKDGSLLFLNQRDTPVDLSKTHPRMVKVRTMVEPYSIAEVR